MCKRAATYALSVCAGSRTRSANGRLRNCFDIGKGVLDNEEDRHTYQVRALLASLACSCPQYNHCHNVGHAKTVP